MPRHLPTNTFQLDLRSSPSQQHLTHHSGSSSLDSHLDEDEDMERPPQAQTDNLAAVGPLTGLDDSKSHKLDLYSIPVFLLEVLVLLVLGWAAYFVHFQYQFKPFLSGFYCDDISYRHRFVETDLTRQFAEFENELTVLVLLMVVPLVVIIFCELVNSMFGSLKFRQIRALCNCCKLHSITRRTLRFSAAYLLGFLLVVISCNVLAAFTGRLRPYFAQECTAVYQQCQQQQHQVMPGPPEVPIPTTPSFGEPAALADSNLQPVLALANNTDTLLNARQTRAAAGADALSRNSRIREAGLQGSIERRWIDLSGDSLADICQHNPDDNRNYKPFNMAMSWPSVPAALVSYACLFIAVYLSFVGTARPMRLMSCILVAVLLLSMVMFDVQLVKDHYNHWDDVAAGSVLAFLVVVFVLIVYLNKFRDAHYYENQKLLSGRALRLLMSDVNKSRHSLDKTNSSFFQQTSPMEAEDQAASNGDLAMRYFQIPRANYRGAPRPLSSLNQMR